jgi:alkylhydroperoxidase family enzyme
MARVSLVEEKDHPELAELIGKIKSGRRGTLLNLYKVLLHAPALAQTWLEHNSAVRWRTDIDGRLREIVIIRVALLANVPYAIRQHVPTLALAEGMTQAECDALADWRRADLFGARERAALAYTDAVTRDVSAPDDVCAELARHFSERQIVELTVLIATYNMQARVMNALAIDLEQKRV